jgi:hypothetical protein
MVEEFYRIPVQNNITQSKAEVERQRAEGKDQTISPDLY